MADQKVIVKSLKERIDTIISLYENTKEERDKLLQEKVSLIDELKLKNTELDTINTKYNTLKIAKVVTASSDDSHEAKIKVNRIVREIDKCIALLNK